MSKILKKIEEKARYHKQLAWLIDPDKWVPEKTKKILHDFSDEIDIVLVGGSLLHKGNIQAVCEFLHQHTSLPVILFPGSAMQIVPCADAVLFLSLVSGRNAEYLIGQQIQAAPQVKEHNIEAIATAYMLVESTRLTTAHYVSQTFPLPYDKPEIAAVTALTARYLGFHCFYLDSGSGSERPVSSPMIKAVKKEIGEKLLWVGGGINNTEKLFEVFQAGADIAVVGNILEQEESFLENLRRSRKMV